MFFSSGEYVGYGKGQYSHAVPAGVAFIGFLFLTVGVIIALRFPGIVTDWTKGDVCVVKDTDKRFKNWVTDADRDVTLSISVRNLTNLEAALRGEAPQFEWAGPYSYRETSQKSDVQFFSDNEHRVTFRKNLVYLPEDASITDTVISVPNLWLLREYGQLRESTSWFYQILPQLLTNLATVRAPASTPLTFWTNVSSSDCMKGTVDTVVCGLFSFPKWAEGRKLVVNLDVDETRQPWKHFLQAVLADVFTGNEPDKTGNTCQPDIIKANQIKSAAMEIDFQCPACFLDLSPIQLLILNHDILKQNPRGQPVWSHLKSCYTQGTIFNTSVKDQQFYAIISAMDEYFFHQMRKQILVDLAGRRGVFEKDHVTKMTIAKPISTTDQVLGILSAIFGANGDHLYDWNTCHVRWNINADINFQWRTLDGKPVEWESKSEYFVPPASNMDPCLRPRAPRHLTLFLDGLWRPATFSFAKMDTMHQETVYGYELAAAALPFDDDFSEDLKLNLTEVLGFQSFITPITDMDQNVAMIYVEPVTGSIWRTELSFELSIQIPDELARAANLTQLAGQRIPIARISRNSTVRPQAAEFLATQLKPMLAIICGGVVVSTLLAITFVALALALVVKLHWKPFRERVHAHTEPQDLQMLNTIKLRKLLGN